MIREFAIQVRIVIRNLQEFPYVLTDQLLNNSVPVLNRIQVLIKAFFIDAIGVYVVKNSGQLHLGQLILICFPVN